VQPIFNAGRTRSQVRLAEAQTEEAALVYRQTVQQAFREVSDALVGYDRSRERRKTQEALVDAARDARRLADVRYQGGASSYLEVLDSDTRLFDAELQLVRARLSELAAFVEVYRALGVIFLRRSQPDRPRAFRVPWVPLFPIISVVLCVGLMSGLLVVTWMRFFGWLILGLVVYIFYSRHHSEFATPPQAAK